MLARAELHPNEGLNILKLPDPYGQGQRFDTCRGKLGRNLTYQG